ncbi:GNAT family N-acetyltransferase [Elizabethkingia anophelis]|uniref:GNAT family acetyltransferase n=2 Tax=Elizabethkingia anophelis TaxID=1117645 RepID=X5K8A6_9FLAO|nr:GNAT family N-acetyltransferase [Elizabethkingia anophelis]AMR42234.1 GNAT family acetyltransferase [Elizabethkingia anophelis]AMX48874.1 GNAT family acetyltransferase [Elizabethkingia anophelis]AMX52333.1 GNAT family acetyltransferase [Elizabethkingia anophelis]AMX55722.1 GNAT family acetyltransferase [Elizabethkingia anophelis]AQW90603.1 GNAT family acetyltransferase [Elizabethkingia anophelis]
MIIKRVDSTDKDFQKLVRSLDADLAIRDGDDHAFYHQFNKIDLLKNCIVIYMDNHAVACGAFKAFSENSVEIKRMYTCPEKRKSGLASKILHELEIWAKENGYKKCVLETGIKQPEAIALYQKNKYYKIPNYGQYAGIENSICFEKELY